MENQEEQTTPQMPPELTITDLQNIRSIIDAASRRGAFGDSVMAAIVCVFNKLDAFINAVAPAQQSADNQPEA